MTTILVQSHGRASHLLGAILAIAGGLAVQHLLADDPSPVAFERITAALSHPAGEVRLAAAKRAAQQPDARLLDPLVGALDDSDQEVRRWAATAIQTTPGAKADRAAMLKWKQILDPGSFTDEERAFLRRYRFWRSLWIFNPKRSSKR